jgi:carbon-monoxide dehydrogenase large subunit
VTALAPTEAADHEEQPAWQELVGQALLRVEDARFLTGNGEYLADVAAPGLKHAAILRSTAAHARITRLDLSAARAAPGVVAAFGGADLAAVSKPFSHLLPMPTIKPLEWHVLATDKVRFVGEPLAVVVADSRALAEDAHDLAEVDYEELPVVVDPEAALAPDAPLLFEEWGSNDFLVAEYATGDLDAAFASADGVLRERISHHRIIGMPLEGHGAKARFDPVTGQLVVHASSQQPHNLRTVLADITGLSEAKIRVIAPDMGGGFGNKQHFMREEALIAVVATQLPAPVAWVQDRYESLAASVHSRQQIHDVEVAYRADGRVLALRSRNTADVGSPTLYFTGAAPALVTTGLMTGTYDIPNFGYQLRCAATNTCPIGAYRGFGQPQALVTIERVMDLVAEQVGLDPAEVRRRNMIPEEPRPWVAVSGARYDVGSFAEPFEELIEACDYDGLRAQQAKAREEGRFVGIGLASMVETTAPNLHVAAGRFGGYEMALVTVQPDGCVNVAVGTKSQGQGHATSLAQVAADVFTVPLAHVTIDEGDTAVVPYGMGTWGSRSAVMGGGVVLKAATQLRDKMVLIAAAMLQVDPAEVTLAGGLFTAGEAVLPFAAVADAAYLHTFLLPPGMDMGLSVVASYDPGNTSPFPDENGHMNVAATYATAAGVAVVEVDVNTGHVQLREVTLVHDCGRVINPLIVEGQIHGGLAQAIGAVLLEGHVYDAEGQLLTSTLLDYLVPTAGTVPRPRVLHRETPSPLLGGFRGAGEAGIILGTAALVNAVHDALAPLGVKVNQTQLGASQVRGLLRDAGVAIDPLAGTRFSRLTVAEPEGDLP